MQYEYGLFYMRNMEEAWNKNMAEKFNPSWINVRDENIMNWYNKFYPGFMSVVQKTYPFGNERHTICCGITSILWRSQIIEVKDILAQLVPKLHLNLGRNVELVLWILKPVILYCKICCDRQWFSCCKWDYCTCGKGILCQSSHREGSVLTEKCSRRIS